LPGSEEPEDPTSRLDREIDAARAKHAPPEAQPSGYTGMAAGYRMAAEFVAAIAVGCVLGIGADWLFGSSPAGLILGVFFGFAAGVAGLVRSAQRMNRQVGPPDRPHED